MAVRKPFFLLINPWITDFAAYDYWSKPLGLLYLAAVLREAGADVVLLDCLDRYDPQLQAEAGARLPKPGRYGTGKYLRQLIAKPAVFRQVPRYYARYGLPLDLFRARLQQLPRPDAVLVTSGMTYWYPGVQESIREVRHIFGAIPILLGGIYATLLPEHARTSSGADLVVSGEAESRLVDCLRQVLSGVPLEQQVYDRLDDLPFPAWDLYPAPAYGVVMTSRGCPLRCSFCASFKVSGAYRWRQPEAVVEELCWLQQHFGLCDVAFYDDALLTNHPRHLQPILRGIRDAGLTLRLHTPNGLQGKLITPELAQEMYASGFCTIRLSLETINPARQKDISKKVNRASFIRAVAALFSAGFAIDAIDAYVLMALPGQSLREVLQTMAFVHTQRVGIRLAGYSPIPGTVDYHRALAAVCPEIGTEPLLTNNSIVPVRAPGLGYDTYNRVALLAKRLNETLRSSGRPLDTEAAVFDRLCTQFSDFELDTTTPELAASPEAV